MGNTFGYFESQWPLLQESQVSFEDFRSSLVVGSSGFEVSWG